MLTKGGRKENVMQEKRLGNMIWATRKARGMTQEELAEQVDITTSHLKHIESGHRNPSIEVLFALAKVLDLSLDALIFDQRPEVPVIHTDGLTPEEIGAVARLVDLLRRH